MTLNFSKSLFWWVLETATKPKRVVKTTRIERSNINTISAIIHHHPPSSIIIHHHARNLTLVISSVLSWCLKSTAFRHWMNPISSGCSLAVNREMVIVVNVPCLIPAFFVLRSSFFFFFWQWFWFLISYLLHPNVTGNQPVLARRWCLMHRPWLCAFSRASDECPDIWYCSWHEEIRLSDRTLSAYNLRLFSLISMLSVS